MRKVEAFLAAALLAALTTVPVSAGSKSGFIGTWSSIDPVDGSRQHLLVRGGPDHVQLQYVDEFGTTCLDIGASTLAFSGVLTGFVSGDELDAWWKSAGCGSQLVLRASDRFPWIFEYDPDTDTLWGATNDGPATWYRD